MSKLMGAFISITLKQWEKSAKGSLKSRHKKAGWHNNYLLKALTE